MKKPNSTFLGFPTTMPCQKCGKLGAGIISQKKDKKILCVKCWKKEQHNKAK